MVKKLSFDWHVADLLSEGLAEYGSKGFMEQLEANTSNFREKYYVFTAFDKKTIQQAIDYGFTKHTLKDELEIQYFHLFEEYETYGKAEDLELKILTEDKIGVLDEVCETLERHGIIKLDIERPKGLGF